MKKLRDSYVFTQKDRLFRSQNQELDLLRQRLHKTFSEDYERTKHNYLLLREKLSVLSPLNTLERGYSICLKEQKALKNAADAAVGDNVTVKLHKGSLCCRVNEIKEETGDGI